MALNVVDTRAPKSMRALLMSRQEKEDGVEGRLASLTLWRSGRGKVEGEFNCRTKSSINFSGREAVRSPK